MIFLNKFVGGYTKKLFVLEIFKTPKSNIKDIVVLKIFDRYD